MSQSTKILCRHRSRGARAGVPVLGLFGPRLVAWFEVYFAVAKPRPFDKLAFMHPAVVSVAKVDRLWSIEC